MGKTIRLQIENRKQFYVSLGLIVLGLCMPLLLNVDNFHIYDDLNRALLEEEKTFVLSAAFRLLLLNILRGFPHYLGAFYLADSLGFYLGQKSRPLLSLPLLALVILLVYSLINLLYHIQYDVGVPVVLMIMLLLLLVRIDFSLVPAIKKAVMIFFLLCTVQCLDVMPCLNGKGFGRGETSWELKQISSFLDTDPLLDISIIIVTAILLISTLLYTVLIVDENHIKLASIRHEQQERQLMAARNHLELRHLVHDLKTPLTSMQTLVGLLQLQDDNPKHQEYLSNIEGSIQRLNELISEFLDEQRLSPYTIQALVTDVMSQISNMPYVHMVHCSLPPTPLWIEANRIRFSRMLVNLIENAYYAVDKEHGRISLIVDTVETNGQRMVRLELQDNGKGMDPASLPSIFDNGFSTRGSSGLGLGFVKEVVECHKGRITVSSVPQAGTTFTIYLPEGECDGE